MKRYLGLMLASALVGCVAGVRPGTAAGDAQLVYQAESDYAVALQAAVAYRGLPPCGAGVALCYDDEVLAELQSDDKAASAALRAAQSAVQNGVADATTINDAVNAVQAFAALSATLKVK